MRMTSARLKVLIFSFAFLFLGPNNAWGSNIKSFEGINFEQDPEFRRIPLSFCMSGNALFLIPHPETGYAKIFKQDWQSLKFLKILGPKGSIGRVLSCNSNANLTLQ